MSSRRTFRLWAPPPAPTPPAADREPAVMLRATVSSLFLLRFGCNVVERFNCLGAFLPGKCVARSPIAGQRGASILDRVAQAARRAASDGVAVFVEDGEFIVTADGGLAAFVIENYHVIGFFSVHRYYTTRASFVECLDDFSRLWARASSPALADRDSAASADNHPAERTTAGRTP